MFAWSTKLGILLILTFIVATLTLPTPQPPSSSATLCLEWKEACQMAFLKVSTFRFRSSLSSDALR